MTISIRATNLSKKYLIATRPAQHNDMLREELVSLVRRLGRRGDPDQYEEFWALRDISFEIEQGARVGVVGRNGAGKSTLLKILSRITEPTTGSMAIRGRVASLLEVGTGFHPELTGRENVYLNGAVLGMRREEIRRKFDEIVAFAEVEKFLDTPVKRYSSGMYVRLAFAVAAHLEPEIFIVDEVLAVGDASFQKKCLDRMKRAADEGVTVLFVSHDVAAIQGFCETAILLEKGRLTAYGKTGPVISQYHGEPGPAVAQPLADRVDRAGNGAIRFISVETHDENNQTVLSYRSGQAAKLLVRFAGSGYASKKVVFTAVIENDSGASVAYLSNEIAPGSFSHLPESATEVEIEIDKLPLAPGLYRVNLHCAINGAEADAISKAAVIAVEPGDFFGTGQLPPAASSGCVLIPHRFTLRDSQAVQS